MDLFFDSLSSIAFILALLSSALFFVGFLDNGKAYTFFSLYLVAMATIEWLLRVIKFYEWNDNTIFLFVYFFIIQFVVLSFFYRALLKYKWINYVTVSCLIFFGFQYIREPELFFKYNPIGAAISQGVIVIYSLLYFYRLLSEKGPFVIINMGVFFYLLSSMLVFMSGNMALENFISSDFAQLLSHLNLIFYFIFIVTILIEWFKNYSVQIKKSR